MSDCLFCKIVNREIPSDFLLETEHLVVFRDIQPKAPVHLLIVPKRHIRSINDLEAGGPGPCGRTLHGGKGDGKKRRRYRIRIQAPVQRGKGRRAGSLPSPSPSHRRMGIAPHRPRNSRSFRARSGLFRFLFSPVSEDRLSPSGPSSAIPFPPLGFRIPLPWNAKQRSPQKRHPSLRNADTTGISLFRPKHPPTVGSSRTLSHPPRFPVRVSG